MGYQPPPPPGDNKRLEEWARQNQKARSMTVLGLFLAIVFLAVLAAVSQW